MGMLSYWTQSQNNSQKCVIDLRTGPWLLGIPVEKAEGQVLTKAAFALSSCLKQSKRIHNMETSLFAVFF